MFNKKVENKENKQSSFEKKRNKLFNYKNNEKSGISYTTRNFVYSQTHTVVKAKNTWLTRKKPIKKFSLILLTLALFIATLWVIPPLLDGAPLSVFFSNFHYFFNYDPILINAADPGDPSSWWTIGETIANLFEGILISFRYAFTAVFLGILISIPLALLSSNNVIRNKGVNNTTKWLLAIIRSLPILMMGLIFYNVFYSDITALLMMILFVVPVFTKWLYEDLDDIDQNTIKSMEVLGLSKWRIFRSVLWPQVSRRVFSSGFFMFEIGFRFTAILGIVGLGGIGSVFSKIRFSTPEHYGHLLVIILFLTIVILSISFINKMLQKYIINYKTKRILISKETLDIDDVEFSNSFMKNAPKAHKIIASGLGLIALGLIIYSFLLIEFWHTRPEHEMQIFLENLSLALTPDWSILQTWGDANNPLYTIFQAFWIVIGVFFFALIFSIPFGLLSSKRISGKYVSNIFAFILSMIRALPGYIFVTFFYIFSTGNMGAFAAVMGLGVNSIGSIGTRVKFLVDDMPENFGLTMKASGGTNWDFVRHSLVPKMLPEIVSRSTYLIELSFKNLLVVGAFGMNYFGSGFSAVITSGRYDRVVIYMALFMIVAVLIEYFSGKIRESLQSGGKESRFRIYWLNVIWIRMLIKFNKFLISYLFIPFKKFGLEQKYKEKNNELNRKMSQYNKLRNIYESIRKEKFIELKGGISHE